MLSLLFLCTTINAGNVLVFSPTMGYSHVQFLGNIADILTRDGHNVTVWAPIFDSDISPIGTTELGIRTVVQRVEQRIDFSPKRVSYNRPWNRSWYEEPVSFRTGSLDDFVYLYGCVQRLFRAILEDVELLDELKRQNFDLAVTELLSYNPLGLFEVIRTKKMQSFAQILEIKTTIVAASVNMFPAFNELTGLAPFPSYTPEVVTPYSEDMSFWQRVDSLVVGFLSYIIHKIEFYQSTYMIKELFPNVTDLSRLLHERVGVVFLNVNEFTESPRPRTNMVKYVGGATVYEAMALPQELENLLNVKSSSVFFSLGTAADSCSIPVKIIMEILASFSEFPEVSFIWKLPECHNVSWSSYPNTVRLNWVPQSNLLADDRVKAFITHGGINSMNEAVVLGKPVVAIPLFGDQFINAQNAVKRGYGVIIKHSELSASTLTAALKSVLAPDSSYQAKAKQIAEVLRGKSEEYRKEILHQTNLLLSYFHPEKLNDQALENFDIFLFSSYYFPKSKSLGDNAVVLIFTADFDLISQYSHLELWVSSEEESRHVKTDIQMITPHQKCRWIDYFAVVETVPSMSRIAARTGTTFAEIPFSSPSTSFHDVVTCIAPLYASEQWQVAILAAHIYQRFGSHMHLYVRSMVSPLFELMREYEKQGYLTLQPWYRVQLNSVPVEDLNPNMNVEFRNQAAAQTDCLLQYKETASFISFVDLDDILIPRLGANYFDEFEHIFHTFPTSAYLFYGKENTQSLAGPSGKNFSVSKMIHSIRFKQNSEMGKFVVQPKYINASWIHWPPVIPKGMRKHMVPNTVNAITHLKHIERQNKMSGTELPLYQPDNHVQYKPSTLLTSEDLEAIDRDFRRMMAVSKVGQLMNKMPEKFFYSTIITDCYREFYKLYYSGQLQRIKCFGPERCQFPPSPGIPCYNAKATYTSRDSLSLNVHYASSSRFEEEDGCIR